MSVTTGEGGMGGQGAMCLWLMLVLMKCCHHRVVSGLWVGGRSIWPRVVNFKMRERPRAVNHGETDKGRVWTNNPSVYSWEEPRPGPPQSPHSPLGPLLLYIYKPSSLFSIHCVRGYLFGLSINVVQCNDDWIRAPLFRWGGNWDVQGGGDPAKWSGH